jgi:hypothetical protein
MITELARCGRWACGQRGRAQPVHAVHGPIVGRRRSLRPHFTLDRHRSINALAEAEARYYDNLEDTALAA